MMTGTSTILDLLRDPAHWAHGATVAALTDASGLHPNTVRHQLARLVDDGTVLSERLPPAGRGRPRLVYRAAPLPADDRASPAPGDPLDTSPEALLARTAPPEERAVRASLTRVLLNGYGQHAESPTQQAEDAGFALAQDYDGPAHGLAAQREALAEHLSSLGFAPAAGSPPDRQVDLLRCPFLDLASQRPDIVCAMHLGLVRGVLAQVPGPLRARGLRPFVGPHRCVLDLDLPATIADPSGTASS